MGATCCDSNDSQPPDLRLAQKPLARNNEKNIDGLINAQAQE